MRRGRKTTTEGRGGGWKGAGEREKEEQKRDIHAVAKLMKISLEIQGSTNLN